MPIRSGSASGVPRDLDSIGRRQPNGWPVRSLVTSPYQRKKNVCVTFLTVVACALPIVLLGVGRGNRRHLGIGHGGHPDGLQRYDELASDAGSGGWRFGPVRTWRRKIYFEQDMKNLQFFFVGLRARCFRRLWS